MKKVFVLLLGLGLWTLGCTAAEDGKDAVPENDLVANDGLGLDGYVPGEDSTADQAGADLEADQGGWTGDIYEDVPQGLGEVFEGDLCREYCGIAAECQLGDAGDTCLELCLGQLGQDTTFGVKIGCINDTFYNNQGMCESLAVCDQAEVSEHCEATCGSVGECGLYRPPYSTWDMWGSSVDECIVGCSIAIANKEDFEEGLVCIDAALETCDEMAVLECLGLTEEVCNDTCREQEGPVSACGLVGSEAHFLTEDACLTWCTELGLGNALAAQSCIGELSGGMYFGFPLPASCPELAISKCLGGGLALSEGAEDFAEVFLDLCQDQMDEEIPLVPVLAWRAAGTLQAAGMLEGVDFSAAMDCAETYETCPGRHAWLSCFQDDHWDYSQADCQAIMACEGQINDEYLNGMTQGDCVFYCDFGKDTFADMLADMHSCLGTTEGNCAAVEVCIAPPQDLR